MICWDFNGKNYFDCDDSIWKSIGAGSFIASMNKYCLGSVLTKDQANSISTKDKTLIKK